MYSPAPLDPATAGGLEVDGLQDTTTHKVVGLAASVGVGSNATCHLAVLVVAPGAADHQPSRHVSGRGPLPLPLPATPVVRPVAAARAHLHFPFQAPQVALNI